MKCQSNRAVNVAPGAALSLGTLVLLLAATLLVWAPPSRGAAEAQAASKNTAVILEQIPGSTIPRVILSARAAERLGIQTGQVSDAVVPRRQMVSGLVVPLGDKPGEARPGGGGFGGFGRSAPLPAPEPAAGGFGRVKAAFPPQTVAAADGAAAASVRTPVAGDVWVLVSLSPGEYERLAKDKPARVLPLGTRAAPAGEVIAQPNGAEPVADVKRTMMSLYYTVSGKEHGLAINDRLRVELPLSGSEEKQKAVPYAAVYYDAKGGAWVYVNPKPLIFERQPVVVDRVIGDQALLAQGPEVGTPVVTVGAALLYGTEIFKK